VLGTFCCSVLYYIFFFVIFFFYRPCILSVHKKKKQKKRKAKKNEMDYFSSEDILGPAIRWNRTNTGILHLTLMVFFLTLLGPFLLQIIFCFLFKQKENEKRKEKLNNRLNEREDGGIIAVYDP
jgi:preprotein translocase subunit YajC